jgi:ComF family protein
VFLTSLLGAARTHAAKHLPSVCAVCRDWGTSRICNACVLRFAPVVPRCRRCGLQTPSRALACGACLTDPPAYTRTIAAVDYDHPWDALIPRFKFRDGLDLAQALADRLIEAVQREKPATTDFLLPMPLSETRLRERGYNQAWELTRRVASSLRITPDARLLLRVKDSPHQLAFPPEQRADNVHAAFAVEPRRLAELRGRHVTLIDDVMTTGATVAEATRTLLRAGAAEVQLWVVARTPLPGSD